MAMDIKRILDNQGTQLLDVDLDVLEEELQTGGYDATYIRYCQELIDDFRTLHKGSAKEQKTVPSKMPMAPNIANGNSLSPFNETSKTTTTSSRSRFARDLVTIRDAGRPTGAFRKLLSSSPYVDEKFIDDNIDLFTPDELKELLKFMPLSERFLQKYFASLDHEAMAKNQEFSEEFFISHYSELDAQTVLKKGVNAWRVKGRRSPKLDMFLRIKGVRF